VDGEKETAGVDVGGTRTGSAETEALTEGPGESVAVVGVSESVAVKKSLLPMSN